ncbi:hypothetical protein [uncultured Rummeliibacillus sp.]|uniref:hypothetical protein n=1 Tax=uncultured Rummeliibacillus sp. TaxID=762292 RepID=UPI0026336119|nr:hypothetical protein [uncultured Rummeliibacillus sp.]
MGKSGFIVIGMNEKFDKTNSGNILPRCLDKYIQTALQKHKEERKEPKAFVKNVSEIEKTVFDKLIFPEICKYENCPWVLHFHFDNPDEINNMEVEQIIKAISSLALFTLEIRISPYRNSMDDLIQNSYIFPGYHVNPYEDEEIYVSLEISMDFYLSCQAVKQELNI